MNGKEIRINKLFSNQEHAVVIAIDHGMFDGPIPGMTDLKDPSQSGNVKSLQRCFQL
jgi:DhnA family fructose-bisphosphate aldolase class Ia